MENTDSESSDPKTQLKVIIAIIVLAILSLGSCKTSKEVSIDGTGNDNKKNLVPFKLEQVLKVKTTPAELKGVQFYISRKVDLNFTTEVKQKEITDDGKFIFINIPIFNVITIPAGTKCVIDSISNDMKTMIVRIDEVDVDAKLKFGFDSRDGNQHLRASFKNKDGTFGINYKNQKPTIDASYEMTILLYDAEELRKPETYKQTVTGVSVKKQ
jgi:hypothetical protein